MLCGVCVGLGFETKMGAALLVVPALDRGLAVDAAAPRGRVRGAARAAGAAMVAAGGAWPLLVALTPASSRPWISGTSDNSIWSLILGYNGLGRLDGQAGGPGGARAASAATAGRSAATPGALRLLNDALGGQAGWLLGFALVAGIALVVSTRPAPLDPATGWLLAAGGSRLTAAVAFSFAKGIFHPYYVSELAPFTAALVGAGVARFAARRPAGADRRPAGDPGRRRAPSWSCSHDNRARCPGCRRCSSAFGAVAAARSGAGRRPAAQRRGAPARSPRC